MDEQLAAVEAEAERENLNQARQSMTEHEVSRVISQSAALNERQLTPEDLSCLPKVGLSDVPIDKTYPQPSMKGAITGYAASCNGLVYEQLLAPLPALDADEWSALPLLSQLWGELGVGGEDYLASQERQLATCGGISAYSVLRSLEEDGHATPCNWLRGSQHPRSRAPPTRNVIVATTDISRVAAGRVAADHADFATDQIT